MLIILKNSGKSDYTIRNVDKFLSILDKHCDLQNPQEVLAFIANEDVSDSTKNAYCYAYKKFCQYYKINCEIPYYQPKPKPIRIPTEQKLEMLISKAGRTLATKLVISKECGLRPVEIFLLKVKDADFEQKLLYPQTAKHGATRPPLKISNRLSQMLQSHIARNRLSPNDKIFCGNASIYGKNYRQMRNNIAQKLSAPSIRAIRLYDFRHWFATNKYHKTKDILLVKALMGHKRIETTLIYTQLLNLNDDEWTCKAAQNIKEATELIEAGFQYVTEIDGCKLFKKRQ